MEGAANGVAVYGSDSYMVLSDKWQGWMVYGSDDQPGYLLKAADQNDAPHYRNFIECVRSRRQPICDIETGHLSTILIHAGNIAMRLGRRLEFDARTESFIGDMEANSYLTREYRKPWELADKV